LKISANQNTVESGTKHHKPNHHNHSRVFNNQQNSNVKIIVKQFVFNHVFSSEEKVLTYFPIRSFVKSLKLIENHLMNIPTISQSNFTSSFWEENVWNFNQSECIIGPDSHVEFKINVMNSNLSIPVKFSSNGSSGFAGDWNVISFTYAYIKISYPVCLVLNDFKGRDIRMQKQYSSVNGRFRVKTTEVRRVHVHSLWHPIRTPLTRKKIV
jgi:hypothetical protein